MHLYCMMGCFRYGLCLALSFFEEEALWGDRSPEWIFCDGALGMEDNISSLMGHGTWDNIEIGAKWIQTSTYTK